MEYQLCRISYIMFYKSVLNNTRKEWLLCKNKSDIIVEILHNIV